jgi:hypothetical protein
MGVESLVVAAARCRQDAKRDAPEDAAARLRRRFAAAEACEGLWETLITASALAGCDIKMGYIKITLLRFCLRESNSQLAFGAGTRFLASRKPRRRGHLACPGAFVFRGEIFDDALNRVRTFRNYRGTRRLHHLIEFSQLLVPETLKTVAPIPATHRPRSMLLKSRPAGQGRFGDLLARRSGPSY